MRAFQSPFTDELTLVSSDWQDTTFLENLKSKERVFAVVTLNRQCKGFITVDSIASSSSVDLKQREDNTVIVQRGLMI